MKNKGPHSSSFYFNQIRHVSHLYTEAFYTVAFKTYAILYKKYQFYSRYFKFGSSLNFFTQFLAHRRAFFRLLRTLKMMQN